MNLSENGTSQFLKGTNNPSNDDQELKMMQFNTEAMKKQNLQTNSQENSNSNSSLNPRQNQYFDVNNLEGPDDVLLIQNIYDLEQINYKLFLKKDYHTCDKIQKKLIRMVDYNPEYYHQQALTHIALNNFELARQYYNQAIGMREIDALYFFNFEIKELLPADFIKCIEYLSSNIYQYKEIENELICECLFAYHVHLSERPQKAMKMLQLLISRYPKSYLPYFYACKCFLSQRKFDTALEQINQAIINFRYKDVQLLNLKGQIYTLSGKYEDALKIYNEFPENLYFQREKYKIENKMFDKKYLENIMEWQQQAKLKQILPEEIQNQNNAINLYQMRKYKEAKVIFTRIVENNPENGFCFMMIGIVITIIAKCCIKLGLLEFAYSYYFKASDHYDNTEKLSKIFQKISNEKSRRLTLEQIQRKIHNSQ